MSTTTYKIKTPWGDVLHVRANLAQASAPIICDDVPTGLQTADVRHDDQELLEAVLRWQGPEFYSDGGDPDEDLATAIEGSTIRAVE